MIPSTKKPTEPKVLDTSLAAMWPASGVAEPSDAAAGAAGVAAGVSAEAALSASDAASAA